MTGADFIGYIRKNPGRFPMIHIKECNRLAATPEDLEHLSVNGNITIILVLTVRLPAV